jgi:hypothetical protein
MLKKKKKLVEIKIPEDECYWNNLEEDEKEALLVKLEKKK